MRWTFRRRRPQPSPDAQHAVQQAKRALRDTERMSSRAEEVAEQLAEIKRRNHFGDAVARAIRGV